MNYFLKITIVLIPVALSFSACSPDKENDTASKAGDTLSQKPDMHPSAISLDYYGTYTGTIPCASCPGIETQLTLRKDSTFALEQQYLDEGPSITERGTYFIKNDIVHLKTGEDSTFYWLAENRLYMLDNEKQKIEGVLENAYILQKRRIWSKKGFAGSYATEVPSKHYSQTLKITSTGKGRYQVAFSAPEINGNPGCSFTGAGKVEHDTLKVILEKPETPVTMVLVRRDRHTVEVFTKKEEDNYALTDYCTGGATLAGSYRSLESNAL